MTARFRIEGGAQFVPDEKNGPQPLAGRAGSYTLLPTSPDLVVMTRAPSQGGAVAAPRVVLAGDASGFALSDFIAFLSQSRWSGVLRVQSPGGERSVLLREGEVRGASSDVPADRLGEVVIRMGYVPRAQVEQVLREHPPSRLGRALVERGMMQAHDLFKCLTHQVSEIFHAMVLCREGTFLLIDQPVDDRPGHSLQLSTQSLLMDSIRKIDEMAHFRKRIPHGRVYVARRRASDGKLEAEEDRLLALLDGQRTLLELAQVSKLSEFDTTKVVFRLLEGGYAAIAERPFASEATPGGRKAPSTPAVRAPAVAQVRGPLEPRTVAQVFNTVFREICAEVSKRGMAREFMASANAALTGQALSTSPVLAGLRFEADGSLPEEKLVEAYARHLAALGSEPLASFRQALSDVMFFLLFQAGELLESGAEDDLGRRVKDLLAPLGPP